MKEDELQSSSRVVASQFADDIEVEGMQRCQENIGNQPTDGAQECEVPGQVPARPSSQNASTTSSVSVDIQKLFENRKYEVQLLSFLVQRMDPPKENKDGNKSEGSVSAPPTYREDRMSS